MVTRFFASGALCCLLGSGMAQAVPVTMTFDFDTQPLDICESRASQGGVTAQMPNQCFYGIAAENVVLGDDGLYNHATVTVAEGQVFDLIAADLSGISRIDRIDARAADEYAALYDTLTPVEKMRFDMGDWPVDLLADNSSYTAETDPLSGLLVQGFLGDTLIASQLFTTSGVGLAFAPEFAGLDRAVFTATNGAGLLGFGGLVSTATKDGYYYACEGRCVGAEYDNLLLDVRAVAVPLPASGIALLTGVVILGAARRRRRRG